MSVCQHTATSTGMQRYSIVRITDGKLKKAIAQVCRQGYVASLPELWIFVADAYRNDQIAREQGLEVDCGADIFFQAWTDACLAAQNLVAASELSGLGTLFLGSILNDAPELISLLNLPRLTFPVVGVGFGYPDQQPQLKPRMPKELQIFENSYPKNEKPYLDQFKAYDELMQTYYDTRQTNRASDKFTKQVLERMTTLPKRQELICQMLEQDFAFRLPGKEVDK